MPTTDTAAAPLVEMLGFSHYVMRVSDLNRAIAFYQRVFGLRIFTDNRASKAEGAAVVGLLGDVAVEIIETASPPVRRGRDEPGYGLVAFAVADAAQALEALKAEGLTRFPEPALTANGHKAVLFRDPDGNVLELIETRGGRTLSEVASRGLAARE